jgi:hypothetical protein
MKFVEKIGWDTLLGVVVGGCIVCVCLLILPRFHPESKIQTNQQVVVFEPPTIKLGKVFQAETIRRDFRLINHSTNSVRVLTARTSCMCTVIGNEISNSIIPPKGYVSIPVEFHTGSVNGFVNAKVEALLEANGNRYYAIGVLEGDVLGDFDFQPRMLDFGKVELGREVTRTLTIVAGACKDLIIELPESSERLRTTLTTNRLFSGSNSYELRATFLAPAGGASQAFSGSVDIITSSKRVPLLKIPVFAMVRAEVEVEPCVLVLAQASPSDEVRFKIDSLRPSRILRVTTKDNTSNVSTLSTTADSNEEWAFTHIRRLASTAIKSAEQVNFELEVRDGNKSVGARFISVQVKSL